MPRVRLRPARARRPARDRAGDATLAAAHTFDTGADRTLDFLLPAWDELSDLEETLPGVELMSAIAQAYVGREEYTAALAWVERALPIAERFGVTPVLARLLNSRSGCLYRMERPNESLILLRGVHSVAVANDFERVHRSTRTQLTFFEQFADPVAGLAMAREGLEVAARRGSALYGFLMVGNAVSCSIRTGDWAWARSLVDEWLENEIMGAWRLELYVDRAALSAVSGLDASTDLAEAARLAPEFADPQYASHLA